MENLKYKILEKANHIDYLHKKEVNAIRRKRWILIAFDLIIIFLCIFSFYFYKGPLSRKESFPYILFTICIISLFLISVSIWVLKSKRVGIKLKDINTLKTEELKEYLTELINQEERRLERGAFLKASAFAFIISILLINLLMTVTEYLKHGVVKIIGRTFDSEELIIYGYFHIFIIFYQIGDLIASPVFPKMYAKEMGKITNQISFCYLTNLDNSIINPNNEINNGQDS